MSQGEDRTKRHEAHLRARAEVQSGREKQAGVPARSAEELLHELQVHQIELEMQNDELRSTQVALEESRDRYADLFEFAPVGYLILTGEGMIAEINLTGAALLGEERKKLLGRRFARFVSPDDSDRYHQMFMAVMRGGEQKSCELALRRRDGSVIHVQIDCLHIATIETPPMMRITLTDVTERKRVEVELRVAATAFESQEGMIVTDARAVILRVNQAFTEITGYLAEEALGQTPRLLKSGRHDEAFYASMWQTINRTGKWRGEIWNRQKSGSVHPAWLCITAVKGSDGAITHYVGTLFDITSRKAAELDIEHLAFYDALTKLPNRRLLFDRLQHASTTRSRERGAVLFIDLDGFKSLNDTEGHDVGDLMLQQVARRLLACVRESDTVARLGGDEFVVMLESLSENPEHAATQAKLVGEKILAALAPPYLLAGREHHCTGSIGATLFRAHRESVDDVLKRADLALYQAKSEGRNMLRFFDPEMQAAVTARSQLEFDLRQAVREGQFLLHYQPQTDIEGRLTGVEALIRWQHPSRGLIPPSEFIPIAEETGLIHSLGEWVLETACAQLVAWSAQPETADLTCAINISAREFHEPEFVTRVVAVVDRIGADPKKLMLEFTEGLFLADLDQAIIKMNALKAHGECLSLDDFGTGYSSLSYLKHLPIDQLKIDRSFVRDILTDPNDAAIVRTIVALGQSMNLAVVAEGVETAEQREFLVRLGCGAFQGYFLGRPGPVHDLQRAAEQDTI